MSEPVTLPFWLAAALALLAAWAILERMLIPSARWFLHRRVSRAIEEIGKRHHREIRPFSLTKRQALIDRLMSDPAVLEAAGSRARERGIPRDLAMAEVERFRRVEEPAGDLMRSVGRVIPVLPVSLVSTVLLRRGEAGTSELELKAETFRLMKRLRETGARIYVPRSDQDYAVTVGLRMLTLRRLVEDREGLFRLVPEEIPLPRYYANSIAHLLPDPEGAPS